MRVAVGISKVLYSVHCTMHQNYRKRVKPCKGKILPVNVYVFYILYSFLHGSKHTYLNGLFARNSRANFLLASSKSSSLRIL
jgi:hypothetical protein